MFTPSLIHDFDSVTNEVLGNILATEFELSVPSPAFIIMEDDFIQTIDDPEALSDFPFKDERVKFATRLLIPAIQYQNNALSLSEVFELTNIDTIFAFDYLVQNRDRNTGRPNFLISQKKGYLIDHEKGFALTKDTVQNAIHNPMMNGRYDLHIFYKYLKDSSKSEKDDYFHTFLEYLRHLDLGQLEPYFLQLKRLGYPDHNHETIRKYLAEMKLNWSNFAITLKALIS